MTVSGGTGRVGTRRQVAGGSHETLREQFAIKFSFNRMPLEMSMSKTEHRHQLIPWKPGMK